MRSGIARGQGLATAIMVVPATVLYAVMLVVPVGLAFYLSLTDWDGFSANPAVVGLDNYGRLLGDPELRRAALVTLLVAGAGTAGLNLLGLGFALLVNGRSRANTFFRMVLFYPHVLSALVVGFLWSAILGTTGAVNSFITQRGGEVLPFLSDPAWATVTMIAVLVWAGFGVNVVLYLAGLQAVPHSLIEAAQIDGATRWQTFRNVTLPALGPSVTVNVVLSLVTLLKTYDLVVSLTAGGPAGQTQTVAYLILWNSFHDARLGFGSAQSVVLMVVTAALAFVVTRLRRRGETAAHQ
ncbi:ABC-type sugar transport system permease subunit [Thermocatellispora tengchongensis]|uniref:ABC-type sugar transport system permease subunit n=1 Tax=Thermocatellispora tengchongensis TaxID=1073253 RepID=A0A840P230_9ACTN|nr:sugar ABC transporter permease [Thermocatellispora tengchongensis]MBB5131297.1 ABC-type sugar transport system permease subunit [Thermocatellispora tengchongensis]